MTLSDKFRAIPKEQRQQALALGVLLFLGGIVLIGPSGLLSWRENLQMLQRHEQEIASLKAQKLELQNRVDLLNPRSADPDLAGELLRRNLNVVHPDDMIMMIRPDQK